MHLLCGACWLQTSSRPRADRPNGAPAWRWRLFARILGARHVGEGLALVCRPSARCLRLAAATDALHCASMLALARISPRWRGPALLSAATASALSACAMRFSGPA
ncbi:MAG: hypothetical protein ACRDJX_10940 [Solirubrobacteraceae bacterium]